MSGFNDGPLGYYIGLPYAEDEKQARVNLRLAYIRQHAPAIMAGLLANPECFDREWCRAAAINHAGLLFDETERDEAKP